MRTEGLQLYIHIPFCIRKCNYCDFLSGPATQEKMKEYVEALCVEIASQSGEAEAYEVDTIFFGGGTPSILSSEDFAKIMDCIQKHFTVREEAEITIEANPGTVTKEKLTMYKQCGVNRISFGLQSAQDKELSLLGRIHSYETFLESFQLARKEGFHNINIDLMSGLPGQNIDQMKDTLEKVLALNPEHISVYSLIVEEGTVLRTWIEEGKIAEVSEELDREIYEMTRKMLSENGYQRYEISNYAKEGYECKHNLGYWNRKNYLGFGIGAASLFEEQRFSNLDILNEYLKKPAGARMERHSLSVEEQMEEFMFLGLRKCEGVSIHDFEQKFGMSLISIYGEVLRKHENEGLLEVADGYVRLTIPGLDLSNYVMADFLEPQIP